MPYTLSHAIIGLPISKIVRGKIPIVALFMGSISPDFPYLLALTPTDAPGHSVLGVFTYCLPPSLLLLFVWYKWLEHPTLDLFRLPKRSWQFDLPRQLFVVLGVLIGAYSHVLWDATSHSYGTFVIGSEFWHRDLYSLPLYKWNQYGSGLFGLVALSVWYLHALYNNQQRNYQGQLSLGLLIYFVCITFFIVIANIVHGSNSLSEYAVRSAIGLITGGIVSTCIYAVTLNIRARTKIA